MRTFQLPRMLSTLSVLDNMLVASPGHVGQTLLGAAFRQGTWRRRERDARDRARALLRDFGLDAKEREYSGNLSGGQQKLLELGRALMPSPQMLMLDEPLASVNRTLAKQVLEHIERLREQAHMTFLFVEHDLEAVMRHADRVIVMANGRVIAEGAPAEIREHRVVREAYLGLRADA